MPSFSTTAFIFARRGSQRVRGKNIRDLAGKPLIAYAIETAKKSKYIDRVIVSTESDEISEVAKRYGAEVLKRPEHLASNESPEWPVWQHAISETYGKSACPMFVSVPATCPFRIPQDIDRCIESLLSDSEADIAITVTPSRSNPYFTGIKINEGYAQPFIQTESIPIARSQDAPKVFDHIGLVYAGRPNFILTKEHKWQGKVKAVEVPAIRALDIDTEDDFTMAEWLMPHRSAMRA